MRRVWVEWVCLGLCGNLLVIKRDAAPRRCVALSLVCPILPHALTSASKDFYDPVGAGRRIYYGWALVGPASTQVGVTR